MTPFEETSLYISALATIATLLAVVVALWGEIIRNIFTKPKLTLKFTNKQGTLNYRNDKKKARYFYLEVSNKKRAYPAKNVRVLLTNVYKKDNSKKWHQLKFSGPLHVTWRRLNITPQYATIGYDEQATFCCLVENENQISLQLYWHPNNFMPVILSNEPTRLEFKVVSDLVESKPIIIEVNWDGLWDEKDSIMQKHLIVKTLHENKRKA